MKKIIVIFGGVSPEHDVSIITGCLAANSLDKEKFTPIPVYVNKKGEWFTGEALKNLAFFKNYNERKLVRVTLIPGENFLYRYRGGKRLYAVAGAVNCMHGGNGENGTIGGLFDLSGIPCTSYGVFSLALSMDKVHTKTALKGLGVKTVEYEKLYRNDFHKDREDTVKKLVTALKFPMIVKPATCGSSVGISVAKDYKGLDSALNLAFRYANKVIVEKYVEDFYEINCAAYRKNGKILISELEKPIHKRDILTFEDKYTSNVKSGMAYREFPADVPTKIRNKIRSITEKVYDELELSSIVRIDYIVSDETVYLNEINAVPGSLAYYLFFDRIAGITDLLTDLLEDSFKNYLSKRLTENEYSSDVLTFNGVALKK